MGKKPILPKKRFFQSSLKRVQIGSEVIAYFITVFVFAAILFLFYKYLATDKKIIDNGELLQFQNKLTYDLKLIGKEYGRFKKFSYTLPKNLNEVCILDTDKKNDTLSSKLIRFYPLIEDSIKSSLNNSLFFVGNTEFHSSHIEGIRISHYPFINCFHRKNDKIQIGMEGLGNETHILADFMTSAKINKDYETVLQSADEVITIVVHKGTDVNAKEIFIEMVEPTPEQIKQGGSDVYKFEPIGTTFKPAAELRIQYNPSVVGECPPKLDFYLFNEAKGEKIALSSKSIDCQSHAAIFDMDKFI